jgi:SAM-dependent methyltransferase
MLSRRVVLAAIAGTALRGQDRGGKMFGDAEAYERFMGRWSSKLAPLLVDFAALGDTGKVLDVGSGTGALAFAIARLKANCEVLGIDPSSEYIGYARSRNPYRQRVTFEVGDAQQLRFSKAEFANSLSLLVFNFIPDRKKALLEVMRVTRPGGTVSAAVWDYPEKMRMLRVFWDAAAVVDPSARAADEAHMPLCRAGQLEELWKAGGLEQVVERPLEITMEFPSFQDFWEPFLLGQGPAGAFVRKLEGERRQALRNEVKQRLGLKSENAPFSLAARAWAVRGIVPAH